MSIVLAYRDRGWYDNLRTEKQLWRHTCEPYNVEFSFMEDIVEVPEGNIVVLDEGGNIPLHKFNHPKEAIYIFGRSLQNLIGRFNKADEVYIETPIKVSFYAPCAAAIVLAHRWSQWQ